MWHSLADMLAAHAVVGFDLDRRATFVASLAQYLSRRVRAAGLQTRGDGPVAEVLAHEGPVNQLAGASYLKPYLYRAVPGFYPYIDTVCVRYESWRGEDVRGRVNETVRRYELPWPAFDEFFHAPPAVRDAAFNALPALAAEVERLVIGGEIV